MKKFPKEKAMGCFLIELHIGILLLTLCCVSTVESKRKCKTNWFGPECQYICHCRKLCNEDGRCEDDLCEKGWFGPQCQYEDIAESSNSSIRNLIDGEDTTCNLDLQNLKVSMRWPSENIMTWMRLLVKDFISEKTIDLLRELDIQFSPKADCSNKKLTIVNFTTVDIHCDRPVTFTQIVLTGKAVAKMCSIYITSGRNVAIKKNATLSTLYSDRLCDETCSYAENAVDGSTVGNLYAKTCTHTKWQKDPWWRIAFKRDYFINKYNIFNRERLLERLQGFNLVSWNSNIAVTNYTDVSGPLPKYTIIPSPKDFNIPLTSVEIKIYHPRMILTICEFQSFGETVCPNGTYGRDCEYKCNCRNKTESCLVSTGGCVSGCDDGYIGSGCSLACSSTFYGKDCQSKCDERCPGQICDKVTGYCRDCLPGRTGNFCEKKCPMLTFGKSCTQNCSLHCDGDGGCDAATGACTSGCKDGYIGALCIEKCDINLYGDNCSLSCSPNCKPNITVSPEICVHYNGHCLHGCVPGYEGWQCNRVCDPTYFGDDCRERCSPNCLDQLCDNINGKCVMCPLGKSGDLCEIGDCHPPYYGSDCKNVCSKSCLDQACNTTTGICLGCPPGKIGDFCDTDCESTYYGQDCLQSCNIGCLDQICDGVTGFCLKCPEHSEGNYCEINSTDVNDNGTIAVNCNLTTSPHSGQSTGNSGKESWSFSAIITSAFIGAILALSFVFIIHFFRKFRIGEKCLLFLREQKLTRARSDQDVFIFQNEGNE